MVAAGGGCSIATGGGLNNSESSTGGASGTNCSAASLGRNVIVPVNAGSASPRLQRTVRVVEDPAERGHEPSFVGLVKAIRAAFPRPAPGPAAAWARPCRRRRSAPPWRGRRCDRVRRTAPRRPTPFPSPVPRPGRRSGRGDRTVTRSASPRATLPPRAAPPMEDARPPPPGAPRDPRRHRLRPPTAACRRRRGRAAAALQRHPIEPGRQERIVHEASAFDPVHEPRLDAFVLDEVGRGRRVVRAGADDDRLEEGPPCDSTSVTPLP